MKNIMVIGGGVVGLTIALELSESGANVINASPRTGDSLSASRAAGAMLGAFGELSADDDDDGDSLQISPSHSCYRNIYTHIYIFIYIIRG